MIRIITYYLPQYHSIPENNRAWGNGFTEWTNVKKAKPLFPGHNQPRKPYAENYYNLLNPYVLENQMKMAKDYGIYGFCFYHYWFCGKKLLEKPLENLLCSKESKLNYCFSWANESWTKTWHGAKGAKQVLIEQTYGKKNEWQEHFNYLLPFFQDKRYIKQDNKPVFLILNWDKIPQRIDMFQYWDQLAKQHGFDGLIIVQMIRTLEQKRTAGLDINCVDFEPALSINTLKKSKSLTWDYILMSKYKEFLSLLPIIRNDLMEVWNYDEICECTLKHHHRKHQYRGLCVGYDDSPRRGRKSTVLVNSTPEKFSYYLNKNIKRSISEGNEFIFINAWNEWGESSYLEPDTTYGFAYLKAVKKVLAQNY